MAPPQVLCNTKDQHPQTFQASIGRAFYYEKKYGKNLHGVYVFGSDSKSARNATFSSLGQMRVVCCKSDKDFDVSFLAPQSAYTPIVQAIKDNNSNYAQHTSAFAATVTLRKEAKLQGVTSVKVWDCGTQCYDPQLIEQGGADVEDQYADTLYLPFLDAKERKANKMLANFYNFTGAGNVGKLGAPYAWSAGIAFRDAVNAIVAKDGVNGVTRKSFLAAVANIHAFDADGMFGKIDLGGRLASPCHVLNQVKNGKFVRVFPKKPGTFDCAKKNVVHPKIDLFT
jgi:ABC-type branched-subunit amino acid transport system substrate-binding protein